MKLSHLSPRAFTQTFFIALFCLVVGLIFSQTVHAANQNITMSPTSVDQTLNPGESKSGNVEIINTGETTLAIDVYVNPYSVSGEDYNQDFTLLPGAPVVTDWFKLGTKKATIEPGKLVDIPYTLTVPKNAAAGGYYAVIFAQTQAPATKAGVIVSERVGEIFYTTVSGELTKRGQVLGLTSSFFQRPPLNSSLRIQNSGNTHFLSDINVQVKDILGHTKFNFKSQKEILPQTIRKIKSPWPKTPSFGLFKVTGTAKMLDKEQTLPTRYVLVMSKTVELIWIGLLVLIIAWISFSIVRRKRRDVHYRSKR